MTLRTQTLLIIGVTLLGLTLALYAVSSTILLNGFTRVEEQNTRENVQRTLDALAARIAPLDSMAGDYAGWDDTYAFVEDENPDFIRTNMVDSTFIKNNLNLILILDTSGRLVYGKAFDLQTRQAISIPQTLADHLMPGKRLLEHVKEDSSVSGLILLPEGPLMVASRPILTSDFRGPIRGTLIMGRFLDSNEVKDLAGLTHLSIDVRQTNDTGLPADFLTARKSLYSPGSDKILVYPLAPNAVAGYALVPNVYGDPILLLRVQTPREVYKQGQTSVGYLLISLIVGAVVFGGVTLLILGRFVLSRLASLNLQVKRIGAGGTPSARVSIKGSDELSSLACSINDMLGTLEQSQTELRSQKEIFESLVAVAHATAERPSLDATLQNSLKVATALTGAERGSLFLIDGSGMVSYRAFAPDESAPGDRANVIGQVMGKGLAGWVARQQRPILIPDTTSDDRWLKLPSQTYSARSVLAVPILSGQATVGVLTLIHAQPGHFDANSLSLMQAAADQLSLALHNAQMFEAQRRMAERQTTLYSVLTAISGRLDLDSVSQTAVDAIVEFAGWKHIAVILPTHDGRRWSVRAASDVFSGEIGFSTPVSQGIIGRVFRTVKTQYVPDVTMDPDYVSHHPAIRSELAVAIRHGGRTLGVLDIENENPAAFSPDDIALAESLAEVIGLGLDNAGLYAETRKYATDLSALYAVTRATGRSLSIEDVLSQALSSALMLLGFEAGLIILVSEGSRQSPELTLATERGLSQAQLDQIRARGLRDDLTMYVRQRRESLVISEGDSEMIPEAGTMVEEMLSLGWRTCAGIPLLHQEQLLGVVCLYANQPRASSAYDLALLTTIGHQIATAVENARLFQVTMNERGRLQALIKSSRDGIILISLERHILVINEPALHLLRLPGQLEDWVGQPLRKLLESVQVIAPRVVEAVLAELRRIQKGNEPPAQGEYEVASRAVQILNLPVLSGTLPLGRLVVLHDVTDERAIDKLREDVTHTMVHDLRNPLTAISGTMHLLALVAGDKLDADQRQMIEITRHSASKMLGLVNSILDVSRLESGRMPVQCTAFEIGKLVSEVLEVQAALAGPKDIRLESDVAAGLPEVSADVDLIRRVIQNLTGNAIKFTPAGGVVRVAAWAGERQGQPVVWVSVSDNGPGIPDEIRDRLFQKFVTGCQEERGSGLGLAFCKLAVEAHGQSISVTSQPDQGTTFTWSLAVAASTLG